MSVLKIFTEETGQVAEVPRTVKIISSDNLATVTAAGYLNPVSLQGYSMQTTDVVHMWYGYVSNNTPGTFAIFNPTISNGQITLVEWANPGNVLLPVVSGDFANFNGTSGQIKDAGYSPSDSSKTKVAMANGAVILNHIATYNDTAGTIGNDAATAINGGNIQAGLSGTAGTLASFPSTALKGSLILAGVANTGNTNTTISNQAMGQASVISIPDPAGATANFVVAPSALVSGNLVKASGTAGLVVDQGVAMKSVAQAAVAGGDAAQTVTDAFCTSASCVVASWNDTSNAVTIQKVAAGNGSFVVTSSGDPGASHLNYIITK